MADQKRGQNSFMRLHSDLEIETGLNLRNPTREAIEEKKESIIANGVVTDFQVYKRPGAEKYTIIEGNTRWLSIGEAIAEGKLPADFLIPCKSAKFTSNVDIVFSMFTCNSGVSLPPIAKAEGYRRLLSYGKKVGDIAVKLGVSVVHINDCLSLLNANAALQDEIKSGNVSAQLVAKRLKKQSSDIIEKDIQDARQRTGSKRITEKHLPAITKIKQMDLTKEMSKYDEFRTWLDNEGYITVLHKFNTLFKK